MIGWKSSHVSCGSIHFSFSRVRKDPRAGQTGDVRPAHWLIDPRTAMPGAQGGQSEGITAAKRE